MARSEDVSLRIGLSFRGLDFVVRAWRKGSLQVALSMDDSSYPRLVSQVPLNGFADAALESVSGFPAEFLFHFGGINGVSPIMARAVFDE